MDSPQSGRPRRVSAGDEAVYGACAADLRSYRGVRFVRGAESHVKLQMSLGIALIVAVAVTGVGWMVLPSLQASNLTVGAEAAAHVERARRIMQRFEPYIERESVLLDVLHEAGVDVDVEEPGALADEFGAEYENEVKASWAAYPPRDWPDDPLDWQDDPRKVNPSFGNIGKDMEAAVSERAAMIEANVETLEEALSEVNEALAVSGGGADARSYTEANRLKGKIEYYRGLIEWRRADAKRREADRVRVSLMDIAGELAEDLATQSLVVDSGVDEQIRALREDEAKTEEVIADRRSRLGEMEAKIAELERAIADATASADRAESDMQHLRDQGVGQGGAASFAQAYTAADQKYRAALRRIQSLRAGDYTNASVQPVGEYLRGAYTTPDSGVEPSITYGLTYYQDRKTVLAAEIAALEQGLEDHRAAMLRLEGVRAQLEKDAGRAKSEAPAVRAAGTEAYDELNRIESEAFELEQTALDALDQAAQLAQQAVRNAQQDASAAGDRLQKVSAENREASAYDLVQKQRWVGGQIEAEVADAHLAKAWIFYQRYAAASRNAEVLAGFSGSLQLAEADIESERAKAKDAHDAGVAEISLAMERLQQAHKSTDRQWAIVAQQGTANSLMAMFGHPEYLKDAVAAYRNAVGGREDQPSARPFVEYLTRLESE